MWKEIRKRELYACALLVGAAAGGRRLLRGNLIIVALLSIAQKARHIVIYTFV